MGAVVPDLGEPFVTQPALIRFIPRMHSCVNVKLALVPEPLVAKFTRKLQIFTRVEPNLVRIEGAKIAEGFWAVRALVGAVIIMDAFMGRHQALLLERLTADPAAVWRRRLGCRRCRSLRSLGLRSSIRGRHRLKVHHLDQAIGSTSRRRSGCHILILGGGWPRKRLPPGHRRDQVLWCDGRDWRRARSPDRSRRLNFGRRPVN
mmetsp:Transcript_9130/g.27639  ORF Transcript_9130/g.27639 Transcript_9130/m.27639 type:complete len:204 (-) Transcript_9130:159-770(-)